MEHLAKVFDFLFKSRSIPEKALETLKRLETEYDPRIFDLFRKSVARESYLFNFNPRWENSMLSNFPTRYSQWLFTYSFDYLLILDEKQCAGDQGILNFIQGWLVSKGMDDLPLEGFTAEQFLTCYPELLCSPTNLDIRFVKGSSTWISIQRFIPEIERIFLAYEEGRENEDSRTRHKVTQTHLAFFLCQIGIDDSLLQTDWFVYQANQTRKITAV